MARWIRIVVAAEGRIVAAARAGALVPMLLNSTGCVMFGLAMPTSSEMKVDPLDVVALADQQ